MKAHKKIMKRRPPFAKTRVMARAWLYDLSARATLCIRGKPIVSSRYSVLWSAKFGRTHIGVF